MGGEQGGGEGFSPQYDEGRKLTSRELLDVLQEHFPNSREMTDEELDRIAAEVNARVAERAERRRQGLPLFEERTDQKE